MHLVSEYPLIWEFSGFVQVPPKWEMKVYLKPGWELKISAIKPKVYLLGINSKQLIDKTFNEIQHFSRLKYTTSHILLAFPSLWSRKQLQMVRKKAER